jgi:seryl-tRNA synthetase
MTLDVLTFLSEKGGDPEVIKESQRKRGHSVEIVDEVISMYSDWVKREHQSNIFVDDTNR